MAKYVVHKKGFYYNDNYRAEFVRKTRTVVSIHSTLEEAKKTKEKEDLISVKAFAGYEMKELLNFLPDMLYDKIRETLELFLESNFGYAKTPQDHDDYLENHSHEFVLPENATNDQLSQLLRILNLTFHDIVEYQDGDESYNREVSFEERKEVPMYYDEY